MVLSDGDAQRLIRHCAILPARAFRTVGFLQGFNFLTTHTEKITEQRRTFIAQHPSIMSTR
ncbi:Uncharacterised protein [Salmonella enterica subsp. enterica]|uniref:Uncharacterized protein n=1 Tax=Salmonella enterica I TaxID=59201 RepID=A0A3S4F5C7_SALET|nr:Uncharacterised protein [Salmonella enterica subsp. enterica]